MAPKGWTTGLVVVAAALTLAVGCAAPTAPSAAATAPVQPPATAGPTSVAPPTAVPTGTATASGPAPTPTAGRPTTPTATGRPTMTEPAASLPPEGEQLLQRAKQEVAERAGVAPADVSVVQIESVEWRDSSLGCPQPGRAYSQVITPGYRFVLQAGGQSYEYHSDLASRLVLCRPPAKP